MEYAKIVAVTGLPGLFELVSSKSDGAIVKSLEDNSSKFVSSRIHNFSHLESIEVYTVRDNVNLVDIFTAMSNSSEKLPDEKDNAAVKKYFENVYPDLDFDRVYSSDMKKMVKWFAVLKANDIEIKLREAAEEPAEEEAVPVVEEKTSAKEEKPKAAKETKEKEPAKKEAKPAAAKSAAKKEEETEEKKEAAPKKKAAPKAKKEDADEAEAPAKKKAASKTKK